MHNYNSLVTNTPLRSDTSKSMCGLSGKGERQMSFKLLQMYDTVLKSHKQRSPWLHESVYLSIGISTGNRGVSVSRGIFDSCIHQISSNKVRSASSCDSFKSQSIQACSKGSPYIYTPSIPKPFCDHSDDWVAHCWYVPATTQYFCNNHLEQSEVSWSLLLDALKPSTATALLCGERCCSDGCEQAKILSSLSPVQRGLTAFAVPLSRPCQLLSGELLRIY